MSFSTHTNNGLLWLSSSLLDGQPVRHGFSTRLGGVSPAPWDSLNLGISRGDRAENVRENYRRFCAAVGVAPESTVFSQQTHSENIRLVTDADAGKGLLRPRDYTDVDALITDRPGLSLVVFSADCGTILLFDPVRRAIGAVHAGWRGVAAGIAAKTVLKMHDAFGTEPANLLCALGPSIGPCCFETDDDVPAAMHDALGPAADAYMTRRGEKWHIDLKGINAHWLKSLGVTSIDICPHCTACRQDLYWSHRKVGSARGAQIALLALEEPT
jgi:YfiH family protein